MDRRRLVRLAHENAALRPVLVPLLRKHAAGFSGGDPAEYLTRQMGELVEGLRSALSRVSADGYPEVKVRLGKTWVEVHARFAMSGENWAGARKGGLVEWKDWQPYAQRAEQKAKEIFRGLGITLTDAEEHFVVGQGRRDDEYRVTMTWYSEFPDQVFQR